MPFFQRTKKIAKKRRPFEEYFEERYKENKDKETRIPLSYIWSPSHPTLAQKHTHISWSSLRLKGKKKKRRKGNKKKKKKEYRTLVRRSERKLIKVLTPRFFCASDLETKRTLNNYHLIINHPWILFEGNEEKNEKEKTGIFKCKNLVTVEPFVHRPFETPCRKEAWKTLFRREILKRKMIDDALLFLDAVPSTRWKRFIAITCFYATLRGYRMCCQL